MTVCTWTVLEELWDALGSWADGDTNGAVSSISPAGQLYLDCRAMSANGFASRTQDIGTVGTGDYTLYVRFKGDVWDGQQDASNDGIKVGIQAGTNRVLFFIANQGDGSNDGIWLYDGAQYNRILTNTWDTNWHTLRLDVHNSQTDADVYLDDAASPFIEDADCSWATTTDGLFTMNGYGTVAGNGEYHIDYLKINAGLCDPTDTGVTGFLPIL